MDQQFSFCWNNHLNQMTSVFDSLRNEEDLVDVTLSCEGKQMKAHKVLLSACSSYFRGIFKENPCYHPVIVFRNIKYVDLEALINFMYKGETNIMHEQLESFLDTAVLLEVKGLTDVSGRSTSFEVEEKAADFKSWQMCAQEHVQETNGVSSKNQQPPIKKRKHSSLTICAKPPERKPKLKSNEVPLLPVEKLESIEDSKYNEEVTLVVSARGNSLQPLSNNCKPDSSVELGMNNKSPQDQQNNIKPTLGGCIDDPLEEEVDNETLSNKTIEEILSESVAVEDSSASYNVSVNYLQENKSTSFSTDLKYKVETNIKTDSLETPPHATNVENNTSQCISSNLVLNSKGCVHLPKDLTSPPHPVTIPTYDRHMGRIMNLEYQQAVETDDDYSALRSEETEALSHDNGSKSHSGQQFEVPAIANVTYEMDQVETEMAKEESEIECEQTTAEKEKKESHFNHSGCEICKSEVKPIEKSNFSHKCPICPCSSSCSHLLKEHMKFVHGWFNVQRRFNQY